MKRWQYYRGVEDPISGTFNLAETISSRSGRILFLSRFALYFVWLSIILYFLLMLAVLSQGNIFMFLVLLSLLVTGIITASLLTTLRKFLYESTLRYSAIKAMREGPPAYSIPRGRNMTERFIRYLRKNNAMLKRMLKHRPELLRKDSYVAGRSTKRHHFDAFILRRPSLFHRLFHRGYPGYSLYVREYENPPGFDDLKSLLDELHDIFRRTGVYPNRVVMLYKAGSNYRGIDDRLYDRLTAGKISLKGKRKQRINLQLAVELRSGHYEFIPFIPELPNLLP
ncbi:MAG TPA: hypothetical protein ENK47_06150 [Euryarchaeota archaeon]|nr:MAG: hypothetical protein B6U90_02400 [Thermoplasmatales archaeon ex4484_6]HHD16274.1 hypothetical protein [Euryarchaeota archaeon]